MITDKWTKDLEKEIIDDFIINKIFDFNENDNKPIYSIDTPPPYLNRPVHIGQATTYAIMDMIARYKRMKGFKIIFPLGLDRNGLPIEMEAEKKYNISVLTTPRKEYLEKCKEILEAYSNETQKSFRQIGISFSSWDSYDTIGGMYNTDSPQYRKLTQKTFIDLYKQGLIYEDEKIANYCPGCRTTIADSEIDYKEIDSIFNTVLFTVKETGEKIPIATTRPELIPSIGMVIYNPEDDRWKHLEGKTAITPLFNIEVPIKAHPQAKQDKGSGLVMMCSAGDYSDIRFFREQGIKPIISIDISGSMNENAKQFSGLPVRKARAAIIEELKNQNLITEQKTIKHKVPICERSKDEVEFIAQKEFYLKQLDYIDDLRNIAEKINFTNPLSKRILHDWLNTVSTDWPISRRRFYATEVPLWYCKKCNEVILGSDKKYQQPWNENPPIDSCPKCGSKEFIGETRVLDTWFDSSNSALYILKYGSDFFEKNKICSLRPQGKEIVRTWLYYSLLKGYLINKLPMFENVYVHQHILDNKGYKMSKSKGNIINPQDATQQYGAESFRLWAVSEGNLDQKDFNCSLDKISTEQKTLNKIWNIAKFISQFKKNENVETKYNETDLWILSEINNLVKEVEDGFESYDFHKPITKLKYFIWDTFSSHYLELVKRRCYNQENEYSKEEQNGAIDVLNYTFKKILYLLYPITPFITKRILQENYNENIYKLLFPKIEDFKSQINTSDIELVNNAIWKAKKDANVSLKDAVNIAILPNIYKIIETDLLKAHTIKNVEYKDTKEIEIKI
jgi:valyl-tRNA synthetase